MDSFGGVFKTSNVTFWVVFKHCEVQHYVNGQSYVKNEP